MPTKKRTTSKSAGVGSRSNKKKGLLSRLQNTPRALTLLIVVLGFGAIGFGLQQLSRATAFQLVGVHPQAKLQSTSSTGMQIKSLSAWNGKIYAGYGDWQKNTGPVSMTPYDPTTNSFAATPEFVADTESVDITNVIGGKLYNLHVDPKSHNGAAYSVADASSGKPVWTNVYKPTVTHAYGMTVGNSPSELFIAAQLDEGSSTNEVSKVFRSTDGGTTWSESLSVPSRGGYNRMMLIAKFGDKIYAQNTSTTDFNSSNQESKAWVFNGTSWSKVTPITRESQPYKGGEFVGKMLALTSPQGGTMISYDGRVATTVRDSVKDYKVHSDGYLYALTSNNSKPVVMRTKDLVTWEFITETPTASRSLAILNNTLYVGTNESELFKAVIDPLTKDSIPPSATLVAPTAAYTVSTSNEFAVNASDTSSVDRVDFYVGTKLIGSSNSKDKNSSGCAFGSCWTHTATYPGSYVLLWNGQYVAAGSYTLKAIAYDIYGNSKETTSVPVTVPEGLYPVDTEKPVVTISTPREGDRLRKSVWVSAYAVDNASGITTMETIIDGVSVENITSTNVSKTHTLARGSHTLIVRATDRAGNVGETVRTFSTR